MNNIQSYRKMIILFLSLLLLLSIGCGVFLYPYNITLAIVCFTVFPFLCLCLAVYIYRYTVSSQRKLNKIYNELTMQDMPRKLPIPAMKVDDQGDILYANEKAAALLGHIRGSKLKDAGIDVDINNLPLSGHTVIEKTIKGNDYQLNIVSFLDHSATKKHRSAYFYLINTTELNVLKAKARDNQPTVIILDVDDGDSILQSLTQQVRSDLIPSLDKLIYSFASELNGVLRSSATGRYTIFTEASNLESQRKKKFPILETVRSLNPEISLTLSIGICSGEKAKDAETGALAALNMATARGGDQAVIKKGDHYTYFGANKEGISIRSKVKSRIFADRLVAHFQKSKDIFIMGHFGEDADVMGAAYAVYAIANHIGKPAHIVLSDKPIAAGIVKLMKKENVSLISSREADNYIKSNSTLIVVDTLREASTAAPQLYNTAGHIIAIDHHRRSKDIFNYEDIFHEPGASSVCEMLTEMVQYVDGLKLTKLQAEILLAGIMIDTKQFTVGTGPRTYEAAAYLLKQSASSLAIKKLLQEDMTNYELIKKAVEDADYLQNGIAIATMPVSNSEESVLAAKTADELLKIKGVNASFTLMQSQKDVLISARSLGNINVQVIMEQLKGGGHMTMAASALRDTTIEDAKKLLLEAINNYLQEEQ